jgi:hypothetical protein
MRVREKIRLMKSLLPKKELLESLRPKNRAKDSKKRKFTPAKGAIRMSRKYNMCITGIFG